MKDYKNTVVIEPCTMNDVIGAIAFLAVLVIIVGSPLWLPLF